MNEMNHFTSLIRKFGVFVPYLITLSAVLIVFFLPQDDFKTILIFVTLVLIFTLYRFESRIPIIFAVLLLLIAGILIVMKEENIANQLATLSYWLLVTGIICILIASVRTRNFLRSRTDNAYL